MYVYRLHNADREHTGLVAEVQAQAFEDGRVLGHEAVQPARVEALVRHFDATPAESDLVALLYRTDPEVAALVKACCDAEPLLRLESSDGLEQTVWRLDDPDGMAEIAAHLGARTHYIADGHHRVAATLRRWERDGRPAGRGVLSVLYPDDQLHLLAFHRRVLGPVDAAGLLAGLAAGFDVRPVAGPVREPASFGMYLAGGWYVVRPRSADRAPGVAGLDATVLHRDILAPRLGVGAVGDPRLEVVSELVPVGELTGRCDADGGAAFLLAPVGIEDLVEVAERHEVMMAKSTYFEPKPRSGIFLRFSP